MVKGLITINNFVGQLSLIDLDIIGALNDDQR